MRFLLVFIMVVCSFGQVRTIPTAALGKPACSATITTNCTVQAGEDGTVTIGTTVLPGTAIATTALTTVALVAGSNGQTIRFTAATDVTLTLPASVAIEGYTLEIIQRGAGTVTFSPTPTAGACTPGADPCIRQVDGYTKTGGRYARAVLRCDAVNDCILDGRLQ